MKPGQPDSSPQQSQTSTKKMVFCSRLNALRAVACISVIITHIVSFTESIRKLLSLHYGGHMAVYFFFNLSGYLLSLSLIKEIRRRLNEKKEKEKSQSSSQKSTNKTEKSLKNEAAQIEILVEETEKEFLEFPKNANFNLKSLFKQTKKSVLVSILCKYLWNRTWRLFPLYFGCWCFLKYFAMDGVGGSLNPHIQWKKILTLKSFPGHLWTMRIEMMFYYYVIPVYICALYIAFQLQKKGLEKASKAAFAGIVVALLYGAVLNLRVEMSAIDPIVKKHRLANMLPPFYFGMLASLVNFALEQKFNATVAQAKISTDSDMEEEKRFFKKLIKILEDFFCQHKYKIIWTLVFVRIIFLNPGVLAIKKPHETWQMANMDSYWYGLFILINDTRGGFWKLMHPNFEPQPTESHPSFLHKIIYYFGLWSYPIYLVHPISYVYLGKYFPESQHTVEFSVIVVFICMLLGGLCDFLFDKVLVNKIILGFIFAKRKGTKGIMAAKSASEDRE